MWFKIVKPRFLFETVDLWPYMMPITRVLHTHLRYRIRSKKPFESALLSRIKVKSKKSKQNSDLNPVKKGQTQVAFRVDAST